jgi:nicotinate-nucleotide pyrophosphorylase (carboxylating)
MNIPHTDELKRFVAQALEEDRGEGDHTSLSTISKGAEGIAKLIIKEEGVLAGVEEAIEIFHQVDPDLQVALFITDGAFVQPGQIVLEVKGSIHAILIAERLVLNVMQRMSGIATMTQRVVKALEGTSTKVLDTRKTTPLLRFLEKKAVRVGGGVNHRFGLYDMILIKDNHVDYAGGVRAAIQSAHQYRQQLNKDIQIEVEVRSIAELEEAIAVGDLDRIMLDNFDLPELKKAIQLINGRFVTEASGGITLQNVRDYASCGVDYVSMGALTHSVKALDMSLKARIVSA